MLAIGNPKFDWMFKAEPTDAQGAVAPLWPRGKVLGGSSSINGMMWVRGQPEDYDGWAQHGNVGWSYDDVLPFFRKSETSDLSDTVSHGHDGPVTVSTIATPHALAAAFIASGREIGIPFNADLNGSTAEGIGPIQANIRRGRRISAATAYLDPARRRRNLKVLTNAIVDSVLIEDGHALGVVFKRNGEQTEARCRSEVVLCAGSLVSPLILMRSGLGPAEHLREHGINVIRDLPGVGRNLQDHASVMYSARVNVSTYNTELSAAKWVKHGLDWLLFGRGPASTPIAHAGAFVRTREGLASPDVQFSFTPLAFAPGINGPKLFNRPAISVGIWNCRPDSIGWLELGSSDPAVPPRIIPNLLSAPSDVETTVRGVKLARRLFEAKAFKPYFEGHRRPEPTIQSDDELATFVRATANTAYHPVGTCKMGIDPMAVVDPTLKVREVEGLRVADASIMPRITSGNTNAPAVMIGEKAAALMR